MNVLHCMNYCNVFINEMRDYSDDVNSVYPVGDSKVISFTAQIGFFRSMYWLSCKCC
jgi:hypothetical protein